MRDVLFSNSPPTPKASGIYSIINRNNLKIYIGSAVDLQHRKATHKNDFVLQKHSNRYFQRAVNQCPEAFEFSIIEIVSDKTKLIEREQFWINFYGSYIPESGYNINPMAESRLGSRRSTPISLEETRNRSEAMKLSYKEGRRIHHNKGKSLPKHHKEAISRANKGRQFTLGRKMPEDEKERRSLMFKGRVFTSDWKRKISESKKGIDTLLGRKRWNSRQVVKIDFNGHELMIFESASEAARSLGKKPSCITSCCRGEKPQAYGFRWKYA